MGFPPGAIPPGFMAAAPMGIGPPGIPPPFMPPYGMNMPGKWFNSCIVVCCLINGYRVIDKCAKYDYKKLLFIIVNIILILLISFKINMFMFLIFCYFC
jgi:hypothetical protein